MNTIGNILWIILGGFLVFLIYLFGSLILILTIVGIPFGIQTLKLAMLSLFPFGKEVEPGERSSGCLYIVMNVIWIIAAGIELAVTHLVLALIFGVTIVGIPFAVQHLKLARLAIIPFGNDIVEKEA
jgi:uncharacterized membrane protein YccF (DUF307 family)